MNCNFSIENCYVRALTPKDTVQTGFLDILSGNHVAETLDNEDYAWGVFRGESLIGYCTVGGADDPLMDYGQESCWDPNALVLCDVFINSHYRGFGLATALISTVLSEVNPQNAPVFLSVLEDDLKPLYEKLGFESLQDGAMVRLPSSRQLPLDTQIRTAKPRTDEYSSSIIPPILFER